MQTPTAISPLSRDEETALMVAFQEDRTTPSFEALYRATAPGLLRWIEGLYAQGRHVGDPLDGVQDTFVNVYRYAGSFRRDAKGGFRAWVRTIASNSLRRSRRRPRTLGVLFSELDPSSQPDPVDGARGPERVAEESETTIDLRKAYGLLLLQYAAAYEELKERDRLALHMVEVEGLSYAEVGERLGVGRSNTKMIVFRARQRLRAHMQGYYADSGVAAAPLEFQRNTDPKERDVRSRAALRYRDGRTHGALAG